MTELQQEIGGEDEIPRSRQMVLAADLKGRLAGPDKDAALVLLTNLRQRPDVGLAVATDIDETLASRAASVGARPGWRASGQEEARVSPLERPPAPASATEQTDHVGPSRSPNGSGPRWRRWALPALVATAVVGATAAAVVLLTNRGTGGDQPDVDPTGSRVAIVPPEVGACRQLSDEEVSKQTNDSDAVDCATVHTTETFHVDQLPELGLPYEAYDPNTHTTAELVTTGVASSTSDACRREFETFVGGDDDLRSRSILDWAWFMPSKAAWDQGARWVRCDLIATATKLQPMTGSGRGLLSTKPSDEWMRCLDGNYNLVPCSETHSSRAVSTVVVGAPEDPWPTEEEQKKILDRQCQSDGGPLMFTAGPISESIWNSGDVRTVACYRETTR